MVFFNYATKEITAKIVYYGPGLCGKTTNLEFLHSNVPEHSHGKLISLATKTDRTLFFDLLPVELGTIRGMKTRLQLYTVPGQVFYNSTRKLVLKGVDGIVFVVDSQEQLLEANFESFQNLKANLREYGLKLEDIPLVIQFNKRDLPNILPVEVLHDKLNELNSPIFEAVATTGIGVQETLRGITKLVLNKLAERDRGEATKRAAAPAPAPPPPAGAPPVRAPAARSAQPTAASFDFQDDELDSFLSDGLDTGEAAAPALGDPTVHLTPELVRQATARKKPRRPIVAEPPEPPAAAPDVWDVWASGESPVDEGVPEVDLGDSLGDFDDPFAGISIEAAGDEPVLSATVLDAEAAADPFDEKGAEATFASELLASREERGLDGWGALEAESEAPRVAAPPPAAPPPPPRPTRQASRGSEDKIDFRAMLQEELDKEGDPFFSPHLSQQSAEEEASLSSEPLEDVDEVSTEANEPHADDRGADQSGDDASPAESSFDELEDVADLGGADLGEDEPPPEAYTPTPVVEDVSTSIITEADIPDADGEEATAVLEGRESFDLELAGDDAVAAPMETPETAIAVSDGEEEGEREIELADVGGADLEMEVMTAVEAEIPSVSVHARSDTHPGGGEMVREVDVPVEVTVPAGTDRVVLRLSLRLHITRR